MNTLTGIQRNAQAKLLSFTCNYLMLLISEILIVSVEQKFILYF